MGLVYLCNFHGLGEVHLVPVEGKAVSALYLRVPPLVARHHDGVERGGVGKMRLAG